MIRFFHSFLSNVSEVGSEPSGAAGVGEPHTGGVNLMNTFAYNDSAAVCDW